MAQPNHLLFQEGFDNDVDALLEEGMPVPKKMRLADDKYAAGDSDHQSDGDGEGGVQPMVTKIKTVLKSEWWDANCLVPSISDWLTVAYHSKDL